MANVDTFEVRPGLSISRILKGGWHLAGGHGAIDPDQAVKDMAVFVEAGITTLDFADIYTGVEDMVGAFRKAYPSLAKEINVNSKFVPDYDIMAEVDHAYVENTIHGSLKRLGLERLDMVQYCWWDTSVPGYLDVAASLVRLQEEGLIGHLGITNYSTAILRELVDAGYPLTSNQLQYSLIDNRAEKATIDFCREHDVYLYCYGALAGGFLSDEWLGKPEPEGPFNNRSLTKYKLIIEDFGGWELFQELLRVLDTVADRHGATIGQISVAWTLTRPQVAGAVIGATSTRHLEENVNIFGIELSERDLSDIQEVIDRRQGPEGDVYDLERDKSGRHGSIMKYNLNDGRD